LGTSATTIHAEIRGVRQSHPESLEEFLTLGHAGKGYSESSTPERKTFLEIVKAIREGPGMYLGHATFLGCCSYLAGDERASRDLELPSDEGRAVYRDFQLWVERQKNSGLPRPWFKGIEFWSGGIDCGHTSNGAFAVFFKWLDQYAEQIGRPGLFRGAPESEAREGRITAL